MHTIQAHAGSIGRMSSAITLCFSFKTPCMKYLHKTIGKKNKEGNILPTKYQLRGSLCQEAITSGTRAVPNRAVRVG